MFGNEIKKNGRGKIFEGNQQTIEKLPNLLLHNVDPSCLATIMNLQNFSVT